MTQPGEKEREEAGEVKGQPGASNSGEADPEMAGLGLGAQASPLDRLQAELEEAQRERNQFRALLQRVQADFQNYRRRVEEERVEVQRNAGAQLLLKLFPILDDLERALAQTPQGEDPSWLEGVRLISKKFQAFLQEAGVQPIDPLGQSFDPWEQEVVSYQTAQGQPEGAVIGVVRKGYKLHGRVLQTAQVVVAKARAEDTAPEPDNSSGKGA